jgi:hypothetical protein
MGIYPGTSDPFLGFDCIWLPKNKGCTRYRMQPQIFEKKKIIGLEMDHLVHGTIFKIQRLYQVLNTESSDTV